MQALGGWMFVSKFIKLLGHYVRYPVDVLLLPVSILFGYFHGGIKMYAVMTLNVVSCELRLVSVLVPRLYRTMRRPPRSAFVLGNNSRLSPAPNPVFHYLTLPLDMHWPWAPSFCAYLRVMIWLI
ncbi:hypothetical protein BDV23DRAFT_130144 [Aspergillus alliaceus]|nr:hypothetical protein BDV23DRAFT_130144 [Aspergillus alliaceus]